jgi:histidinol-phosphatase (PHP family)
LINCHFHDDHSFDGVDPLLSHCERAAAEGLKHMCVTNHAEVLEPDGSWTVDIDEMRARFAAVRESVMECRVHFPELEIGLGIELEYRREWTDTFDRLTEEVPFDFVLGSVHLVDGLNVSGGSARDRFFEDRSQDDSYSRYFRELDELVEWGGFDVVAHFDLVKRYGHLHYGGYEPERFRAEIQPVLERMTDRHIGIEINTSGVFGPGAPFPERQILEWALETGVPALTIGTDSHASSVLNQGLPEGIALARAAGWSEFTVYEGRRQEVRVPIEDAEEWLRTAVGRADVSREEASV